MADTNPPPTSAASEPGYCDPCDHVTDDEVCPLCGSRELIDVSLSRFRERRDEQAQAAIAAYDAHAERPRFTAPTYAEGFLRRRQAGAA
jgi:hypothetical protein